MSDPTMRRSLTEGPVRGHLVSMSLPMVWGLLAVIGFNVVDTFFVGQLGTLPLAAISYTFPVVLLLGSITFGLGTGATSVVSRAIGEGDRARVKCLASDALLLALVIVAILTAIGLATIDPVFRAMGASDVELPLIRSYMQIWYWGTLFLVVPMVGNSVIRATGDAKAPSALMVGAALVNVLLDPLLIFGGFGVPAYGIEGAATATVIARMLTTVASVAILHFRERLIIWHVRPVRDVLASWKDLLAVGLPAAATNAINPLSIAVITRFIADYGAPAVAAFGVATRIEALATIPMAAIAAGTAPIVGQNWGAARVDRVAETASLGFRTSMGWGLAIAGTLFVAGLAIVKSFDESPAVQDAAQMYLRIVPVSYGLFGVMIISATTFNAIGKPLRATVITVIRMLVLYLPAAYLGGRWFGLYGIFAAAAISNIGTGLVAWRWNRRSCSQEAS